MSMYSAGTVVDKPTYDSFYATPSTDGTIYVSKTGNDSNSGLSPGTAKLTIAGGISALPSGGLMIVGNGTYSESALTPANGTEIRGATRTGTTLNVTANVIGCDLTNSANVIIKDFGISLATTAPTGTGVRFNNAFQCHLDKVKISGQHTAVGTATYQAQIGIQFTGNAGDNTITDFLLNNLGVAATTDTAMNWFIGGKFTNNYRGVVGGDSTGTNYTAGCSFQSVTWTGSDTVCDHHVYVNGSAGPWGFTDVWFEKALTAVEVGSAGTAYGPVGFSMDHVHQLSAANNCLIVNAARQTKLGSLRFNYDPTYTPTELTINATNAAEGFAENIISHAGYDIARTTFPPSWTYFDRSQADSQTAGPSLYVGQATTSGNPSYIYSGAGRARLGYDGARTVVTDAGGNRDVALVAGSTARQVVMGADGVFYVGAKTQGTANAGGAVVALALQNAVTLPTSNPSGGGVLFVNNGALYYLGPTGYTTRIAADAGGYGRIAPASTTITDADQTVVFNGTSAISQALPSVAAVTPYKQFELTNKNTGVVTLTDTISGTPNRTLAQWSSLTVYSDGSTWLVA
jgi:hypothetical protein